MLKLLILLAAEGPFALFWAGPSTYLVDAGAAKMYSAPGWYSTDSDGRVWRHRMAVDTFRHRRGLEGETWPANRWTVFEQVEVGERTWKPLTPAPTAPPPGQGHLQAEYTVVQYLGDSASLLYRQRRHEDAGVRGRTELITLRLPFGTSERSLRGGTEAVNWLSDRLPDLVGPCAAQPLGALTWELPGGEHARYMALGPNDERCAARIGLLPMGAVMNTGGGLAWWSSQHGGLPDVRDARPNPDLDTALILRGAALEAPPEDLLDEPCAARAVHLWRSEGPMTELGPALRLDGARWLPNHDPLLAQLPLRFRAVGAATPCTRPLPIGNRLRRPRRPTAHLCRIDEDGRAWAGPADLAGSATVAAEDDVLRVAVRVRDPDRDPKDGVHIWLGGDQRRTLHFQVREKGVSAWGNRETRRRVKAALSYTWDADEQGYTTEIAVPLAMGGRRTAVAIQVHDVDPDVPGSVGLWVGGHRISAHARRPIACEPTR